MSGEPNGGSTPPNPGPSAEGGQPANRKYAGKYLSVEELERGYKESNTEAQRLIAEKRMADAQVAELQAQLQLAHAQRQARPEDEYIQADEDGRLRRSDLQQIARDAAREAVVETMRPLQNAMDARSRMEQQYEDYGTLEADIRKWMSGNPEMRAIHDEIAATSPRGALEFAYSKYRDARVQEAIASGSDLQAALEHGKAAGRVTSPSQTRIEEPEFNQETYRQKLDAAEKSGNWDDFLDYRLKGVIRDWQFPQ